jgi:hypothetical protein
VSSSVSQQISRAARDDEAASSTPVRATARRTPRSQESSSEHRSTSELRVGVAGHPTDPGRGRNVLVIDIRRTGPDRFGNPFPMGLNRRDEHWRHACVELHTRWLASGNVQAQHMLMPDGTALPAQLRPSDNEARATGDEVLARLAGKLPIASAFSWVRLECSETCSKGRPCHGTTLAIHLTRLQRAETARDAPTGTPDAAASDRQSGEAGASDPNERDDGSDDEGQEAEAARGRTVASAEAPTTERKARKTRADKDKPRGPRASTSVHDRIGQTSLWRFRHGSVRQTSAAVRAAMLISEAPWLDVQITTPPDSPRPQTPSSPTDTNPDSDPDSGEARAQTAEGPSATQRTDRGHQPRSHATGRLDVRERAEARERAHRLGDVDGVLAEVAVWPDTVEIDNTPDYSQQLGPEAQRSIQLWAERRDGSDEDLLAAISAFDRSNGGSSTGTPAAAEDTDMTEAAAAETGAVDTDMAAEDNHQTQASGADVGTSTNSGAKRAAESESQPARAAAETVRPSADAGGYSRADEAAATEAVGSAAADTPSRAGSSAAQAATTPAAGSSGADGQSSSGKREGRGPRLSQNARKRAKKTARWS